MTTVSSVPFLQVPPLRDTRSEAVRKADPKNILGSGRLHPVLSRKIEQLIDNAAAQGLDLYVQEGFRSAEAQARIPSANTRAKPGYSFHNFGLAADIVFRGETGGPSWSENHDWKRLGELGKSVGLEWGGDWKSIQDRPHFQYSPHHGIGEIRQLYQEGGLKRVWENIQ
jgi:peptidoglycan L-alanyl-D-glutamate endopeptidase CwlK